jgi:hypothetical protein
MHEEDLSFKKVSVDDEDMFGTPAMNNHNDHLYSHNKAKNQNLN